MAVRGQIRPTTPAESIERALRWSGGALLPVPLDAPPDTTPSPLRYRLDAGHNGGANPFADHPGSLSYGSRVFTADCSGFLSWCLGADRHQPGKIAGAYISTDSILADADREVSRWFEHVDMPLPGDVVVYPGVYLGKLRIKVGHCGLVVRVGRKEAFWSETRVVHCSSGADRRLGYAISETSAELWRKRGRFVRFLRAAPF